MSLIDRSYVSRTSLIGKYLYVGHDDGHEVFIITDFKENMFSIRSTFNDTTQQIYIYRQSNSVKKSNIKPYGLCTVIFLLSLGKLEMYCNHKQDNISVNKEIKSNEKYFSICGLDSDYNDNTYCFKSGNTTFIPEEFVLNVKYLLNNTYVSYDLRTVYTYIFEIMKKNIDPIYNLPFTLDQLQYIRKRYLQTQLPNFFK
jgi:hypothetical protein